MAQLEIEIIQARDDNYIYLLFDPITGTSGVVDPADAGPVIERLRALNRGLDWIANTHHHYDHIAGNPQLVHLYGSKIAGPRAEVSRIPNMDVLFGEGDRFVLGSHEAAVLETPGHTSGHISYWFENAGVLFSGDTLFALGCGRLFEGTPEQMHTSLSKFANLPDATRVYCGHEYTQSNANFALSIDPNNAALRQRAQDIARLRGLGEPTIPTTMGTERDTNPFLRSSDPEIRRQLGMMQADDVEVFAEIRRRKDTF